MGAVPYHFDPPESAADLRKRFGHLGAGEETGVEVTVAGRMMLSRPQGRLAFAQLRDSTGVLQLFASDHDTPDFSGFCSLSLGDWIGVKGEVITTRRGELSVRVGEWVLLARARRGFGDKWRGVNDTETRYRQRYVDLWANERSRWILSLRIEAVRLMRRWLEERGFAEVETPILHQIPGGALALPFVTHYNALDTDLYLRVAPELYLKRLVVGGFEKVFEIARVFRNEGVSPRHAPEFTMLELYQAYADYHDMMALTEELVSYLAEELRGSARLSYGGRDVDLTPPWRRATLYELVAEETGVSVDVAMSPEDLRLVAGTLGVEVEESWGSGKLVLEIYEKTTESRLRGPVFVCDYPKEVSPLARDHRSKPGLVERFEPVVAGRELGNAFTELVDPDEQRLRFEAQAAVAEAGDGEAGHGAAGDGAAIRVDTDYLRALEHGLPPTAGLGIGVDRLAMLLTDVANIREVIAFPTLRPEA